MRFFSNLALIILFFAGTACAVEFPNPSGYVNDYAKVIDNENLQKLQELCKDLESRTSVEMAIVTVDTVEPLDPKSYAVRLFENWGIGKNKKDNGILILLAMKERKVEIEPGYGLEGVVTDQFSGSVLDTYVIPGFKENNFGSGLYNGASALADRISQQLGSQMPEKYKSRKNKSDNGLYFFVALIILFAAFASFVRKGKIMPVIFSVVVCAVIGYVFAAIFGAIIGAVIGIIISFGRFNGPGGIGPIFTGGFGGFGNIGGGFGGGFGGFGGGRSGGGGAGRGW